MQNANLQRIDPHRSLSWVAEWNEQKKAHRVNRLSISRDFRSLQVLGAVEKDRELHIRCWDFADQNFILAYDFKTIEVVQFKLQ